MTNYMCYISTTSVLDKHNRCVKKQFDTLSAVLTHQNSQDNTPEIFCVLHYINQNVFIMYLYCCMCKYDICCIFTLVNKVLKYVFKHFQSALSTFSSIYCNQYSISYVTQNATLFLLNSQHLIKTSFRKWSLLGWHLSTKSA